MLLFISLFIFSEPVLVIDDTAVFKPLNRNMVAVTEGHIYFIQTGENTVRHYNDRGNRLPDVGRAGQGPGEYQTPFKLFVEEDTLYVHDFWRSRVQCYDLAGNHRKTLVQSSAYKGLFKVPGGWILSEAPNQFNDHTGTLTLTDDQLEPMKTVFRWREKPGKNMFPFSVDIMRMSRDRASNRLFVYAPAQSKVHVLDLDTDEHEVIGLGWEPLPFDEEWGRQVFEEQAPAGMKRGAMPPFPEAFPLVSDLLWTPWRTLHVVRGARPDTETAIAFDPENRWAGKKTDSALARRYLGRVGSRIYLQTRASDDTVAIVAVDLEELSEYLKHSE